MNNLLDIAADRGTNGRPGLMMQGRFPAQAREKLYATSGPYAVFIGFDGLFSDFAKWAGEGENVSVHRRLYHPERVDFEHGQNFGVGNLAGNPAIRDYNQVQFLINLIRGGQPDYQGFMLEPDDSKWILSFIAADPNAQIFLLKDLWLPELFSQWQLDSDAVSNFAAGYRQAEEAKLEPILNSSAACTLRQWSFGEIHDQIASLAETIQESSPLDPQGTPEAAPKPEGFDAFLDVLN